MQIWIAALLVLIFFNQEALAQQSALKAPLHGLVYMSNIVFHRQDGGVPNNSLDEVMTAPAGTFDGITIDITWAQLQPTPESFDTTALDRALADVKAYNQQYPLTPFGVKLRVWPEPSAPDWVKNIGGAPVSIFINKGLPITVGRFWTLQYRGAWRKLQMQLANKYDSDPLIRETSNTSCSTITNEPMLVASDAVSIENMKNAGYTDDAFRKCLNNSSGDYDGWKTTRVDFFVNPYRALDSGRPTVDLSVDKDVMRIWRHQMGNRGSVGSAGFSGNPPPYLVPLFEVIRQVGPPIELQMFSPNESDYDAAVKSGVAMGATVMELWGKAGKYAGFTAIAPEKLAQWSAALKNNPIR